MTTTTCLTDDAFLAALETCALPPGDFDHTAHLRAAYLYARAYAFPEALMRMRVALQTYTAALGRSDRYHETITTAFMAILARRLHERGDSGGWDRFACEHGDLFDRSLLLRYFPADVLSSDLARQVFVLPEHQVVA